MNTKTLYYFLNHLERVAFILFFSFCFLLSALCSLNASDAYAGNVLLRSPDAKHAALSDAVSSLDADKGGITVFHYNPAATAFFRNPEISFMGQKGFADDQYGSLFFGYPTQIGTFSGDVIYYSVGDIELINSQGQSRTVKAEEDLVAAFNYGESYKIFGAGLNIKILNSKLADSVSANAVAVDLGTQIKFSEQKLSVGAAVQNLGSGLQYIDENDSLPLTLRGGVSHHFTWGAAVKGMFLADLVKIGNENVKEYIGIDTVWSELFAVRGGYKIGQELGKFSFGFGFIIGKYGLDYAYTDAGNVGKMHSVSMNYKFGVAKDETVQLHEKPYRRSSKIDLPETVNKKNIAAVLNLKTEGINESDGLYISDLLRNAVVNKCRMFQVVGKEKLEKTIKEKYSVLIRCNEIDCAINIANSLKAEKVIIGSLGQMGTSYVLRIRLIDVKSSRIEYGDSIKSSSLQEIQEQITYLIDRMIYSLK